MSPPKVFLLDANVFIEAAKRYYALDIAPGFWVALIKHAQKGHLRSIDKIKGEIDKGKDDLKTWVNGNFPQWFESTNQQNVITDYATVMAWAQSERQFTDAAQAEFASNADGWLIAYAMANGCVLVTEERYNPDIRRRIMIPNVCKGVGVPYMDTFEMLRVLGVKLN